MATTADRKSVYNGPEGDQRRTEESPENRRAQLKFEQREKAKKLEETRASLVKTEDPSEVLSDAGLAELRKAERSGEPLKGKTFEMKDG